MISAERKHYNNKILPMFIREFVKAGALVVDVGKPNDGWGYRERFKPDIIYKTLDRNADLEPDIVDDMEDTKLEENTIDCIICWGTMEQCGNPFKLTSGIWKVLKPQGYALFGILSIGYPLWQDIDLCRFTPQGVEYLLADFATIIKIIIIERENVPSCVFTVVQK